jgi:nucleosome binding factor SPN SPT16 subunit
VGVLSKDKQQGKFIDEWNSISSSKGFEKVDVSNGLATVLAQKDDLDVVCLDLFIDPNFKINVYFYFRKILKLLVSSHVRL